MASSRVDSKGFSRFPHNTKAISVPNSGAQAWFYEEPAGICVCVQLESPGQVGMFLIPKKHIRTYVRHLEAAEKRGKEPK